MRHADTNVKPALVASQAETEELEDCRGPRVSRFEATTELIEETARKNAGNANTSWCR
jgi:hypothetical protein